jgi:hypothetical protein
MMMKNEKPVWSAVAAATAFFAEAAASARRCRDRQLRLPPWKAVAAATALHTCLLLTLACHKAEAPAPVTATEAPAIDTKTNGIVVAALQPAANVTTGTIGYATVVDLTDLFASASQYAAAQAQRQQAAARVQSSNAELARQRILNADNHNISDRALQETAAGAASDAATLHGADTSLTSIDNAVRQRWGTVLANGVLRQTAWARGLLRGDSALLEVAFSTAGAPPATISVQSSTGQQRSARFIGTAPRVDARLQRAAYHYLAGPASEFPVGMSIELAGRTGATSGVLVPASAVVWANGVATVFVEESAGHFTAHPIDASARAAEGFVVDLPPGTRVVVEGAQQLLSEQNKPAAE